MICTTDGVRKTFNCFNHVPLQVTTYSVGEKELLERDKENRERRNKNRGKSIGEKGIERQEHRREENRGKSIGEKKIKARAQERRK